MFTCTVIMIFDWNYCFMSVVDRGHGGMGTWSIILITFFLVRLNLRS